MNNLQSTVSELFTIFAVMSLSTAFGVGAAVGIWLWCLGWV